MAESAKEESLEKIESFEKADSKGKKKKFYRLPFNVFHVYESKKKERRLVRRLAFLFPYMFAFFLIVLGELTYLPLIMRLL